MFLYVGSISSFTNYQFILKGEFKNVKIASVHITILKGSVLLYEVLRILQWFNLLYGCHFYGLTFKRAIPHSYLDCIISWYGLSVNIFFYKNVTIIFYLVLNVFLSLFLIWISFVPHIHLLPSVTCVFLLVPRFASEIPYIYRIMNGTLLTVHCNPYMVLLPSP